MAQQPDPGQRHLSAVPDQPVRGGWTGVAHAALVEIATRQDVPAYVGLLLLALARCDADGHARFGKGELSRLLDVDRYSLRRSIGRATGRGLLLPGSGARCLIVPGHYLHSTAPANGTDGPCPWHRRPS